MRHVGSITEEKRGEERRVRHVGTITEERRERERERETHDFLSHRER